MTGYQPPSLRLALGLGDQELEQRLRPALDAADDLVVVAQCLAADQLLQAAESYQLDAVVVGWSLHRLTDALLNQLDRPGLLLVLLVPDPHAERWRGRRGPVLGVDTQPAVLRHVLVSGRQASRAMARPRSVPEPVVLKPADRPDPRAAGIIAVTGGVGSPGRTTVAINLAAALSSAEPTVLVEADLCAPSVVAYLDRDPTRNICTLAHTVREDPHAWSAALADELQPLGPDGLSAKVLCGPPKREMRSSIAPGLLERLIAELAQRYRWVVLDVGPELLGIDTPAANHRAALSTAHHVLLVAASDLVGLWHARVALDQLERQLGIDRRMLNLVLNRHDPRFHHARSEVEWHLGAPVAAVVPFDHAAAQRAVCDQRPLIMDPTRRASRALLALAERLNDGKLRLPDEAVGHGRRRAGWWRLVLPRRRGAAPRRLLLEAERAQFAVQHEREGGTW